VAAGDGRTLILSHDALTSGDVSPLTAFRSVSDRRDDGAMASMRPAPDDGGDAWMHRGSVHPTGRPRTDDAEVVWLYCSPCLKG